MGSWILPLKFGAGSGRYCLTVWLSHPLFSVSYWYISPELVEGGKTITRRQTPPRNLKKTVRRIHPVTSAVCSNVSRGFSGASQFYHAPISYLPRETGKCPHHLAFYHRSFSLPVDPLQESRRARPSGPRSRHTLYLQLGWICRAELAD